MQYSFVYDVASRISADNLLHYLEGSYDDYVHVDSSIYIRKISQQPTEFCHYVLNGIQQVFSQAVLIIITVIAILFYNPLLFPLLLLILVPPIFLIAFFMKRKLASAREHGKRTSEKSIQHLQEALSGFVESNIYGQNDFFKNRYQQYQSKLNYYLAEKQIIQNMPSRLIEVFAVFGLFALVLINSFTNSTNSIQIVTIGAFMAAAYKVIPGIVKIMNMLGQIKTYTFTVTDLLNNIHPFSYKRDALTTIHSIEFENIHFSYGKKTILQSFNMKMQKGDLVGISGISGKGKTTVANLLLGFLSPGSGNILINEKITGVEERKSFWKRIAYTKQQPFFIHDSIIKNIVLQDEQYDRNKLFNILSVTGVDKLVNANGTDTIITENGKNFSGGQRQRVMLARALYKDADLLILDEPFNELDEATETAMLSLLQKITAEGKMVLLITHNKEALAYCNKTILMNEHSE